MVCSGQCKSAEKGPNSAEVSPGQKTRRPEAADEIWGSDDESVSPYAHLKRAHVNQGYLDGISQAHESGLQRGFDEGFPQGARMGMAVGELLARAHGTEHFLEAKRDLNISSVLDKKYFDEQLDLVDHLLLKEWQKKMEKAEVPSTGPVSEVPVSEVPVSEVPAPEVPAPEVPAPSDGT